jgi:acetylornithine deacetylase/succinyl-diaminopimelate desuccinylase-like protein
MREPVFRCVPELVDLACCIQQIPAPTFFEGERAQFILQQFVQLGLEETSVDAAGNVYGLLRGDRSPKLAVISAHLDTVHPLTTSLALRRTPDRVIGAGIGDNSLGLAALMGLVWMLKANQETLPGNLWLVANICEEGLGNLMGIQAVTQRFKETPIAYIILEGSSLGEIYHRGLGVDRYRISVKTEGGHSWHDFGKPSAIHILSQIASRLVEAEVPSTPRSSMNIGKIEGGISINSIAPYAMLELDLRSEEASGLQKMVRKMKETMLGFQQGGAEICLEQIGTRPAGMISPDHPLVTLAHNSLLKVKITPHLSIGSTDANIPLSLGYPAVCLGVTKGGKVHTTEEYIEIEPIAKGMLQLYYLLIRLWETG